MTPKEKAIELVEEKFAELNNVNKIYDRQERIAMAKISVRQSIMILIGLYDDTSGNKEVDKKLYFWMEVKNELEFL